MAAAVRAGQIGRSVRRTEDPRLLAGAGCYLADLPTPGEVHLYLVRSPLAHARITAIETSAACGLSGVVGVFSADDLPDGGDLPVYPIIAGAARTPHPPLARDVVRFVGEPVVAVLGESPPVAADAASLVDVRYEPLPAVAGIEAALADGAPLVHDGVPGNVAASQRWTGGDVDTAFSTADKVVALTMRPGRVAPLSIEPRGAVARYEPSTDEYTLWTSTQVPHRARTELAGALGIPESSLRIIVPDVGGGFGGKVCAYREDVLVLRLARLSGRPVRWVPTRGEDLQTTMHAREELIDVSGALSSAGRLLGLRVRQTFAVGAYLQPLGLNAPWRAAVLVPGAYAVPNVASEVRAVYTHTTPTGPYRGSGRTEAAFVVERLMDVASRELGVDPAELRRRNFVPPQAFPYTTPLGQTYDSGEFAAGLDHLLEVADYPRLRAEQAAARARGERLGIGLVTFVEPSGGAIWEGAQVRVERSGEVTVLTGAGPHGQGHATTFAQIVADHLGVPLARIRVRHGDTAATPPGVGSFGSRTVAFAGGALVQAAARIDAKARRLAAHLLEVGPADVERVDGGYGVVGAPGRSVRLAELAATAYAGLNLPPGEEPGLEASALYRQPSEMFGFGAHLAVVRLDAETGAIRLERLVAVDDSGTIVNPLLAEGQIAGGVAQGIGQALLERVVYEPNGQLLTGSLLDYAAPRARDLPALELHFCHTPSPLNPLGAKGVGEAGAVGAPGAVINAVVDALADLGVRHVDPPVTAEVVWGLLRGGAPNRRGSARLGGLSLAHRNGGAVVYAAAGSGSHCHRWRSGAGSSLRAGPRP